MSLGRWEAASGEIVYWFAGFRPAHHVANEIDFVADQAGAGLARLAGLLVTAAMIFSWRAGLVRPIRAFQSGAVNDCVT